MRGQRLRLRAAGEDHERLRIEAFDVLRTHDAAVRDAQLVEAVRDFDVVHHAAADEADFASHDAREVNHLLNAVNRTGKARDDDFAVARHGIILPGAPRPSVRTA